MIVIPMAGLSSRFFNAGYTVPKYMLDLGGQSVFEWSVSSFKDYYNSDDFLFIIFDQFGTFDFVEDCVKKMGIRNYEITILPERTLGQADTVYQGIKNKSLDEEMYIFNIDSRLNKFEKIKDTSQIDGYLEVFEGEGEHWSFVLPGENNRVLKTTEKHRISNLCSNGLYYFKSSKIYEKYFNINFIEESNQELYIAPIYNNYIKNGMNILYKTVKCSDIEFCGTPQEYLITLNKIRA
ncbi:glycosyltransferase family protein [Acinetobacter haemolyticus]|uniref:capsular biosynthesis protein n=1 Tax=Acinetobacter haemolyticus TaxID=29430 RepID=UPI0021CD7F25|nr:capsular biosynthesis protein [Acinetobacter haemolyticus]MCU4379588.1 capsular biosynthesis protein [Acinetobacter haemolyticus]